MWQIDINGAKRQQQIWLLKGTQKEAVDKARRLLVALDSRNKGREEEVYERAAGVGNDSRYLYLKHAGHTVLQAIVREISEDLTCLYK